MIEVARDRAGSWYFCPAEESERGRNVYICQNDKGAVMGRIYPEYLANPDDIWFAKCRAQDIAPGSQGGMRLKPGAVVYKLWEHAKNA